MFTLGENPYGDIPRTREFLAGLQMGHRLHKPQFASKEM